MFNISAGGSFILFLVSVVLIVVGLIKFQIVLKNKYHKDENDPFDL